VITVVYGNGTIQQGTDAATLIQAAITSLPSTGGIVFIKAGAYTMSAALTIAKSGVVIQGEGRSTVLTWDGAVVTTGFIKMADTTDRSYIQIKDLYITSSTANAGLAINMDYFTLARVENVGLDSINQGIDISNGNAFYNYIENVRIICGGASGFGIRLAKNEQLVVKTRISANDSNNVTGIIINAHGCGLYGCDIESGANVLLIGVDVQANGHDTLISDCYLEANATNLKLAASIKSFNCIGGFAGDGVSANITDSGALVPTFLNFRTGNTTYNNYTSVPSLLGTETNSSPVAGGNDTVIGATVRRYTFFTLPTTAPLYRITGIEWLNGTVVNGTTFAAVEQVDAIPPSATQVNLVAWTRAVTQTGGSGVQRNSVVSTLDIPGGTILGAYVATNSASGRYGTTTVASANNSKSLSGTPVLADTTAWSATTEEPYIKVYYKPVFATS
jgi:hypothetical protein